MQLILRNAIDPERSAAPHDEHPPTDADIERLLGRVHASLDAEQGVLGKLRALPTRTRWLVVATAVALMVGGVFAFARRVDFDAYPPWRLVLTAATYVALLALIANLVLRPFYRRGASASREMILVAASFLAPFGWALAPVPVLSHPVDTAGGGRDCFALGVALGTTLIVLFRALDRAPQTNLRSVAILAAGAGLVANLAFVFHCPQTRPLHLVLVHAPIGLVLLLICRPALARLARTHPITGR